MTGMLEAMTHSLIGHGGPLVLFIAATLEGPNVTVVAAALAQKGMMDIRLVLPIVFLGDVVGDVIVHLAGRIAAEILPAGLRQRLGLDRHVIEPLAERFRQGGGRLLIVSKLTHVAGLPMLFASGVARMPLWRFLLFTAVAAVPKVAALCLLGWFFEAALTWLHPPFWLVVLALIVAAICLWPFLRGWKERQSWS